jgi:hypothetical protein
MLLSPLGTRKRREEDVKETEKELENVPFSLNSVYQYV